MIQIHNSSITLKIDEEDSKLISEDSFDNYLDFPVYIDRKETKNTILWLGLDINFEYAKESDTWYSYPKRKECSMPTYEKIYLKLIGNKI